MKVKLKIISEVLKGTKPTVMSDGKGNTFFIAIREDGDNIGSIYPQMIKLFGKEIEVEEDINPDTYIHKEFLDKNHEDFICEGCYVETKIRSWMIDKVIGCGRRI